MQQDEESAAGVKFEVVGHPTDVFFFIFSYFLVVPSEEARQKSSGPRKSATNVLPTSWHTIHSSPYNTFRGEWGLSCDHGLDYARKCEDNNVVRPIPGVTTRHLFLISD